VTSTVAHESQVIFASTDGDLPSFRPDLSFVGASDDGDICIDGDLVFPCSASILILDINRRF
jgi:hypothetical protein